MKIITKISAAVIGLSLLCGWGEQPKQSSRDFDFYVLSLSWSPSYCLRDGANGRGGAQCRLNANYGFIVHGLWPQYENGYPRQCPTSQSGPSAGVVTVMQDIMPSRRLVEIEWSRHGTCSGLSAAEYFRTLRRAREMVQIPSIERNMRQNADQIEASFIAANPRLNRRQIAVTQSSGIIEEVRICLSKSLQFRNCPQIDARGVDGAFMLRVPPRQ